MYCAWTLAMNDVYRTTDVIKRDGKLYDKLHHTFEFKGTIYFDIVWLFSLTELPSVFQRYITSRASVRAAIQMVDNAQLSTPTGTGEHKPCSLHGV